MNLPKWAAGTKAVLTCVSLSCALLVWSSHLSFRTNASPKPAQTASSSKNSSETEMAHMSPGELATYIFEHHGCDSCHTMGSNGKTRLYGTRQTGWQRLCRMCLSIDFHEPNRSSGSGKQDTR